LPQRLWLLLFQMRLLAHQFDHLLVLRLLPCLCQRLLLLLLLVVV
jgi:hypothetical protein